MIPWYNMHPLVPILDQEARNEVKEWMKQASNELERLEKKNEQLEKILKHFLPEMSGEVFITGISDTKDEQGFPDRIHLCIEYGSDSIRIYKRIDKDDPNCQNTT